MKVKKCVSCNIVYKRKAYGWEECQNYQEPLQKLEGSASWLKANHLDETTEECSTPCEIDSTSPQENPPLLSEEEYLELIRPFQAEEVQRGRGQFQRRDSWDDCKEVRCHVDERHQ